ncbi:uncharacterized protein [Nicotiana sylvestris]|uniref:uncharacterized protein n=1 Tax=Nicotiana sylvestris TaxID=4096 RepID=UPI00388C9CED
MIQHLDKNYINPIPVRIHNQPTYCDHVKEETDGKPWFHDIKEYLAKGEYSEHANHTQKRILRRLSNHFFYGGENLYRRTPGLGLLRCVNAKEASKLLGEIHDGTCYQCQVHADMIKVSSNELNATSLPWPCAAWGMDVIGPIEPTSSNGHRFILVAIDYFTKWVEAASYKAVTKKVIADFFKDCIVCRFGVPEFIVTDNAANLNSDLMKSICETFKIKYMNSIAYRPQMNRDVEAANKNIKKILRKMVENRKKLHEKLPFALLGYRTTVRTSTGATIYLLVYGTEAVIPAEVEIPSFRIIKEVELSDAEWIKSHYEQLALIDEKKMNAICHGQLYQNRMSRAFNKRVKPRQFALGQLVLKKIFPHQDKAKGKFSPKWQGPYMVHSVLIGGAFILTKMDREIWPKPINSDAVKRYYA